MQRDQRAFEEYHEFYLGLYMVFCMVLMLWPKSKLASTWMDVHEKSTSMSMDANTKVDGHLMPSRGRRGGSSAREGEQRREEQAKQQAPAPQGPVLPPPPPVDYGVFMQGLVQAMQT
ncbi:hypothetical protein Taro_007675 [Colocasia esculenta]|uniref:Uncharacterized protein n=1 Tax=Colocasia esculenta TaxID=4460 RepID=A0A843TYU6_COLES|nr:hypothetical protein [Colocasia esculenta]